jgi:hypothetical protein
VSTHDAKVERHIFPDKVVATHQSLQLAPGQIEIAGYGSADFHAQIEFFRKLFDQRAARRKNPPALFDAQRT